MSEYRIHLRADIEVNWLNVDPVIGNAEPVWTKDRKQLRIGDGIRRYSELPILANGEDAVPDALAQHIVDTTPHPAYDDMPDLQLYLENGMV